MDLVTCVEANPSHLETVNTVTLGRARAKQYYLGNTAETRRMLQDWVLSCAVLVVFDIKLDVTMICCTYYIIVVIDCSVL